MRILARYCSRMLALLAALVLTAQPVAAQSVLRDAETEALLQDMVDPLAEAAGLERGAVDIVLLQDGSLNAFVAGGQRIFVHSGLIEAADSANEVQGVLAHELGHITGGHIIRSYEGMTRASRISILSVLVGVAAALAGAGEAGMGAMALGQQAAMSSFLSFSRVQEASADAASLKYLQCAGIDGAGLVAFFRKLQNLEYRYAVPNDEDAGFSRTHPLTSDRISRLEAALAQDAAETPPPADLVASIGGDAPSSSDAQPVEGAPVVCRDTPLPTADLEARFARVKAKLYGYIAPPQRTLDAYPEYMTGVPARYARAYAFHKDARVDKALEEVEALIASDPADPYFLELKGQVLLESGRPEEALAALRRATDMTGNEPLIASTFGHALIATEDPSHLEEAERVLRAAVARDRENPFAWYQLGVVYGSRGDMPRARLASAEQQIMTGRPREALRSAEAAERGLPAGSTDWIRAQDVAMQARAELERQEERR